MGSAQVAALEATRFLPFLEPAEEKAVLATAPVKSFAREEVVLDQGVPLRAIFLIEDGCGSRRAPGSGPDGVAGGPRGWRILR